MITSLWRRCRAEAGVRPFNPFRDYGPVMELIAVAFKTNLGSDGQVALDEMRRLARLGPLAWLFLWPSWSKLSVSPGFVWVDQGRIQGNVSLRRATEPGSFFIGNLAVHPDCRGRGIARALMEAALDAIEMQGGRWVGLEVRQDNMVAQGLYKSLEFRPVGSTLHMLRPPGALWAGHPSYHPLLRRARARDSSALIELVRVVVPPEHRPLLGLRIDDYSLGWERTLDCWLTGRREVWWVVEDQGAICGAVRALRELRRRLNHLEVLISPEHRGQFEAALVRQGIAALHGAPKKMIDVVLPSPSQPLVDALEAADFQQVRVLVQMRLDL